MQTTFPKIEEAQRAWYVTSAKGQVLGRLATKIALTLMGKRKPTFCHDVDQGDFVVVTDVESIEVTGKKADKKIYKFHTGFIGGLQEYSFNTMQAKRPEDILMLAVRRMLPKTTQARDQMKRLKLCKGPAHPHTAQHPQPL